MLSSLTDIPTGVNNLRLSFALEMLALNAIAANDHAGIFINSMDKTTFSV
jgi:hypothetical protein